MRKQNETCRRLARKPFGELLEAMVRDPALLIWLDAPANRKGHPNENLARELMELFTPGHRPLQRVRREGDRPRPDRLDGHRRRVPRGRRAARRRRQDRSSASRAGGTERTSSASCSNHPSTAHRLAWRLCDVFMGEGAVGKADLDALADGLAVASARHRLGGRDGAAIPGLLRRAEHPARESLGPVEYIVGAVRVSGAARPAARARWCWPTGRHGLGQDLFNPPNVGGWPGGRSWLSARSLIGRANFAAALVEGRGVGRDVPLDPIALARRYGRGRDDADAVRFCAELLTGHRAGEDRPLERLGQSPGTRSKAWDREPPAARRRPAHRRPGVAARLIVSRSPLESTRKELPCSRDAISSRRR